MPDDLGVTVIEEDDAGAIVEVIARCCLVPIGRGAYEAAIKLRPHSNIILKDGARVVERHTSEPKPPHLTIVKPIDPQG